MLVELNHLRAANGVPALSPATLLAAPARRQARRMIAHDSFAHSVLLKVRGFDRVGETIALQPRRSGGLRRLVNAWARSPSHRAILLDRSYAHAGVGAAGGRFRGGRATAWVVRVGGR